MSESITTSKLKSKISNLCTLLGNRVCVIILNVCIVLHLSVCDLPSLFVTCACCPATRNKIHNLMTLRQNAALPNYSRLGGNACVYVHSVTTNIRARWTLSPFIVLVAMKKGISKIFMMKCFVRMQAKVWERFSSWGDLWLLERIMKRNFKIDSERSLKSLRIRTLVAF